MLVVVSDKFRSITCDILSFCRIGTDGFIRSTADLLEVSPQYNGTKLPQYYAKIELQWPDRSPRVYSYKRAVAAEKCIDGAFCTRLEDLSPL